MVEVPRFEDVSFCLCNGKEWNSPQDTEEVVYVLCEQREAQRSWS